MQSHERPIVSAAIICLATLASTATLANWTLLSTDIRVALTNYRPMLVVLLIVFLYFALAGPRIPTGIRLRLLVAGLLYPILLSIVGLTKGIANYPQYIQAIAWSILAFGVTTSLTRRQAVLAAKAVLLSAIAMLTVQYVAWRLMPSYGVSPFAERRQSFGVQNPNVFAQTAQVMAAAHLLLFMVLNSRTFHPYSAGIQHTRASRLERILCTRIALFSVLGTAVYLTVAAVSRNVSMGLLILFGASLLGRRARIPQRTYIVAASLATVGAIVVGFTLAGSDIESRRAIWAGALEGIHSAEYPTTLAVLMGPQSPADTLPVVPRYDDLMAARLFDRQGFDSTIVTVWFEVGILGLAAYLLPYLILIGYLCRRDSSLSYFAIAAVASLIVQGSLAVVHHSFGSPASFGLYGFLLPLTVAFVRQDSRERFIRHEGLHARTPTQFRKGEC